MAACVIQCAECSPTFQDWKPRSKEWMPNCQRKIESWPLWLERSVLVSTLFGSLALLKLIPLNHQEAKNTAALKAQIEKLQQERDEFQKMVIGNQVKWSYPIPFPYKISFHFVCFICVWMMVTILVNGMMRSLSWFTIFLLSASTHPTNSWNEEERKGIHQIAGELLHFSPEDM